MRKAKAALGESVMSTVNETIRKPGRPRKERTLEEKKEILPEASQKIRELIQQKKPERSLDLTLEPPKTPEKKEKKPPKITQRVIHEEDSEPEEIIEEVIIKKKKKPIVRRKVVYEESSSEEEEELPQRKSKSKSKVVDPVASMTNTEIQNEMRRIQMEMLSKSIFGN